MSNDFPCFICPLTFTLTHKLTSQHHKITELHYQSRLPVALRVDQFVRKWRLGRGKLLHGAV
ncbi:hypothetical protein KY285_007382 [Solanum tuberosum]|nr:hypothetical protein KY285_007382 [Solanum tuberosum]